MTHQNQISTPTFGFMDLITAPNELSREGSLTAQPLTSLPGENSDNNQGLSAPPTQINEQETTVDIILKQLSSDTISDWFIKLSTKLSKRYRRLPRGSWPRIAVFYNNHFNDNKSVIDVRNLYNRAKLRLQQQSVVKNQTLDRASDKETVQTICNPVLFHCVSSTLLKNIDTYRTADEKPRTKKIYSCELNSVVIEMLNIAMLHNNIPDKIRDLKELNNVIYACQKTYEEITEKPRKPSAWKENIENKIRELKGAMLTLSSNPVNAPSSQVMKKLCKKYKIHSNDRDEVDKLHDRLLETCVMYEKKLEVAKNRASFHRTNRAFELNRKTFYRDLDGELKQVNPDINRKEVASYWQNIWKKKANANNFDLLANCLKPINFLPDISPKSIGEMTQTAIKYLSNWKAPGHDRVYNFFIKK